MATTIKELMTELNEAWDELQELREELKRKDELINALCYVNIDYLERIKEVSDRYGADFAIAVFACISSLTETVSTFGAEEALHSLRLVRKTRERKEGKVDK